MRTGCGKDGRRQLLYVGIAAVVLLLLWVATFRSRQGKLERTDVEIVFLGDSLVGQCREEDSVPEQVSRLLGKSVFNGAMGGTTMTPFLRDSRKNYGEGLLNMVDLSKAIAADDFGVQQTVRSRHGGTDYFSDNIDDLERVNFASVEILVLEYGINDYHAAVPIENPDKPLDESTYKGAIRSAVRILRKAYPKLRIVMVTPTYAWYVSNGLTCEEYDTGNGFLEKYVNAQIETAHELNIEVVDLYHAAYPHETWDDWARYTEDGMHPNETGRRVMAELIAEQLRD